MSELTRRRKIILIAVVVVVVIVAMYGIFMRHTVDQLSFQAYAPTVLPAGVHVTGHDTTVYMGEGEYYKAVSIRTNLAHFGVGEEKSTAQQYNLTTFSCHSKLINATCTTLTSAKGQQYSVQTIFEQPSGKVTSQNISWQHDDTRFWISLRTDLAQSYTPESWGKMIDSFKPVSYGNEAGKTIHFAGG